MIVIAATQPSPFTTGVLYPSLLIGFSTIIAVMGYLARAMMKRLTDISDQQAKANEKFAVQDARYPVNLKKLEDTMDVVEEMRGRQNVDHAILAQHLRWHERHETNVRDIHRDDAG